MILTLFPAVHTSKSRFLSEMCVFEGSTRSGWGTRSAYKWTHESSAYCTSVYQSRPVIWSEITKSLTLVEGGGAVAEWSWERKQTKIIKSQVRLLAWVNFFKINLLDTSPCLFSTSSPSKCKIFTNSHIIISLDRIGYWEHKHTSSTSWVFAPGSMARVNFFISEWTHA